MRLAARHNCFEGERVTVRVVAIGHATNRVPKNLDRRFRHMGVIVGCASLAKIFQDPGLFVTSFDVSFRFHAGQGAKSLKLLVRP